MATGTNQLNPIRPLGVGEVVLRVADLRRSIDFYRDVLGFPLIRVLHDAIAFMRVADGAAGHTQIIGLFDRKWWSSCEGKRCIGGVSSKPLFDYFTEPTCENASG